MVSNALNKVAAAAGSLFCSITSDGKPVATPATREQRRVYSEVHDGTDVLERGQASPRQGRLHPVLLPMGTRVHDSLAQQVSNAMGWGGLLGLNYEISGVTFPGLQDRLKALVAAPNQEAVLRRIDALIADLQDHVDALQAPIRDCKTFKLVEDGSSVAARTLCGVGVGYLVAGAGVLVGPIAAVLATTVFMVNPIAKRVAAWDVYAYDAHVSAKLIDALQAMRSEFATHKK